MNFGLESRYDRKPELCIGDVVVFVWAVMAVVGLYVWGAL
jgi:hypothetical protein